MVAWSRSPPCRPPISPSLAQARPAPNSKAPLPAQRAMRLACGTAWSPRPPPRWGRRCWRRSRRPGPTRGPCCPPSTRAGARAGHARSASLPVKVSRGPAARGGGGGAGWGLNSFPAGRWPPRPPNPALSSTCLQAGGPTGGSSLGRGRRGGEGRGGWKKGGRGGGRLAGEGREGERNKGNQAGGRKDRSAETPFPGPPAIKLALVA